MSNISDFLGGGGGGAGLKPKFQEFTSSGTFTPSQALIDAGGYIEVFLVGGGARAATTAPAQGGEVLLTRMYLTSTSGVSITIGSGSTTQGSAGSDSVFSGASAGGSNVTAQGGRAGVAGTIQVLSPSWGSTTSSSGMGAGTGIMGYGAGAVSGNLSTSNGTGVWRAKDNSGQGSTDSYAGGSGYCLITWYE